MAVIVITFALVGAALGLGVGGLLLVVGYFAPAPPKPARAEAAN